MAKKANKQDSGAIWISGISITEHDADPSTENDPGAIVQIDLTGETQGFGPFEKSIAMTVSTANELSQALRANLSR